MTLKNIANSIKYALREITETPLIYLEDQIITKKIDQKITPIVKVGLYIPGGTASYPSTVLMSAIPAMIAGVKDIVLISPPNQEGKIAPSILVAADMLNIKNIFKKNILLRRPEGVAKKNVKNT